MALTQEQTDTVLAHVEGGMRIKDAIDAEGLTGADLGWLQANHGQEIHVARKLGVLKGSSSAGMTESLARLQEQKAALEAKLARIDATIAKLTAHRDAQ